MAEEIERKFLVRRQVWSAPDGGRAMIQGYLSTGPRASVRVRIDPERARLNIKGPRVEDRNYEFEMDIPRAEAEAMLSDLCEGAPVEKVRYEVPFEGYTWEVDEFSGANQGLVTAEVEMQSREENPALPDFVGTEVSRDERYLNVHLTARPFSVWQGRDEPAPGLTPRFSQALVYASSLHGRQFRKGSSVPYISHLLGVAALVLECGGDEDQAIAALLHDAAEDQGGRPVLEAIRQRFGARVASIVEDCSDDLTGTDDGHDAADTRTDGGKPPWKPRKSRHLEHLKDVQVDALLVVAADKISNLRSIASDLESRGESVWEKFRAGREEQLWYYRGCTGILEDRGCPAPLLRELKSLLERVAR